jgi:hypothetical protein
MKYDNTHYYEAPRIFWPVDYKKKFDEKKKANVYTTYETDKYKKYHELSVYAKWLYQTLKELEHRHTGKYNDAENAYYEGVDNPKGWFYCGSEKLTFMSGMSESSVKRAKKELIEAGLVKTCVCHLLDKNTGERTKIHVTGYRVYGETELFFNGY